MTKSEAAIIAECLCYEMAERFKDNQSHCGDSHDHSGNGVTCPILISMCREFYCSSIIISESDVKVKVTRFEELGSLSLPLHDPRSIDPLYLVLQIALIMLRSGVMLRHRNAYHFSSLVATFGNVSMHFYSDTCLVYCDHMLVGKVTTDCDTVTALANIVGHCDSG